jgi:hypothetical protein
MFLYALVPKVILEIHSFLANKFPLHLHQGLIHVFHHLVARIPSVEKLTLKPYVHVYQTTSEVLLVVDQNVLLIQNALLKWLA